MNTTYIEHIKKFSELFNLPISYFEDDIVVYTNDKFKIIPVFVQRIIARLNIATNTSNIIISPNGLYFAIVSLEPAKYVIIGPSTSALKPLDIFSKELKQLNINEIVSPFLASVFSQFYNIDIKIFKSTIEYLHFNLFDTRLSSQILDLSQLKETNVVEKEQDKFDDLNFDGTLETDILRCIELGLPDNIHEKLMFYNTTAGADSIHSNTYVHLMRDIFLTSAALSSRAAVRGGLDFAYAINIADNYILKFNEIYSVLQSINLLQEMFQTFATEVKSLNSLPQNTPLIKKISSFVYNNKYQKLSSSIIAEQLFYSDAYLCHHFKQHTKITITKFIHNVKINEAKYLLGDSKLKISDISNMLSYSSQSHFNEMFKKNTGITPRRYRLLYSQ